MPINTSLAGTGCLGTPVHRTAYLLADSAKWQSLCGAIDQVAALAFIHAELEPAETPVNQPSSILADVSWERRDVSQNSYRDAGELLWALCLPWDTTATPDEADAVQQFKNDVGEVIADLCAMAGTDAGHPFLTGQTHPYLNQFSYVEPPLAFPHDPREQSRGRSAYLRVALLVRWRG